MKLALEHLRDEPDVAINTKVHKMLQLLKAKGHLYQQVLQPHLLTVHPQNRSGLMLNSWDMHEKGLMALKVGWQEAKVAESYCFEVNPSKKEQQLDAMRKLVAGSEQQLAPVSGLERYMTVSCSHMSQFAKAAGCGQCCSPLEELQPFTVESLTSNYQDEQFQKMVKEGWSWWIIQSDVEVSAPWFPQMLQAALNTGNHISKVATEVELAMSLVYLYKTHGSMETALQICAGTSGLTYIDAVALFTKNYGGGASDGFPVVLFLQATQKLLSSSVKLGEDFMTAISKADFRSKTSTYPMVRTSLILCNCSSPSGKIVDGVSRLILRSDVEKLKGPSLRASLEKAESLLRTAFDTLQKADGTFQDQENVKLIARLFIRSGLWLCKKSGKGQESRTFESLDEIHEAFKEEASGKAVAGPASSSSASEVLGVDEKVWTLQAPWHIFCMAHFFGVCRHLSFLLAAKKTVPGDWECNCHC